MSIDFNKMFNEMNSSKGSTPTDEIELELQGRSKADYSRSEYTETPIKSGSLNETRKGLGNFDLGDFMDFNELILNDVFMKLVYFKSYSTSKNTWDKYSSDIIFDFIDRNGLPIRSRKFSGMNTSNQITLDEKLKKLQGNPVWLEGKLIKSGNRLFIDVIHIRECAELMGKTEETRMFFRREVGDWAVIVGELRSKLTLYPVSQQLYREYETPLSISTVPGVIEVKGSYLRYLYSLLTQLDLSELPTDFKDILLLTDLVSHLKTIVEDPFELSQKVSELAKSLPEEEKRKRVTEVIAEALYDKYQGQDVSVYQEIIDGLRKGLFTLLLFEDWSHYSMESVFSPYTKRILSLRRD